MSREDAARVAREELADPIYGEAEPSLVERLYMWALDWLEQLMTQAGRSVPGGWWVLGPLLAVVALLVLGIILYTRPARRSRRRATVFGADTELTAADHRDLAERHAAEGRYPEAIRERMRAVNRDLEERAVITPRPGRTATELAAETSAALPERRADLYGAAALFNDVWYGDRTATAEGYGLVRDLDDALRSAVPAASTEPTP
ncbi:uncharacterized protein DUF4129 [Actinorugispora endophytica]|uniref:Uncharacterized protein DUF4129 n=1 Tax=Actinorugispora endophytica TaxID=1605990 RepID=A0A4R6UX07_9ACTN|nr:uncharacterized protein DUF4129 [Actinorugispora endophytica]